MSEKTLKALLESAGGLKVILDRGEPVAVREVAKLRFAFDKCMQHTAKYEYSKRAVQCDNLLTQLMDAVSRDPDSFTGDAVVGAGSFATPPMSPAELRKPPAGLKAGKLPAAAAAAAPASPLSSPSGGGKGKGGGGAAAASREASPAGSQTKKRENWKFTGIPPRRRLQTLVVSLFLFFTGVPFFLALTGVLVSFWLTLPLMVLYFLWIFLKPLRHPLPRYAWYLRAGFWTHYRDYFPIRLVIPKPTRMRFSAKKNYLFAYHPHGVHSFGAMINFGSDVNGLSAMLPGITVHTQTLKMNFYIPFWRELFLLGGCGDASASCIKKTLTKAPGESVLLVVGGAEESLRAEPGTNNLTLSKRKGFVRLALQTGAALVPVYGFGENNVYENWASGRPKLQRLQLRMQKALGFAVPAIHGRGYFNYHFGILPHRRPIVTVVGNPLELPKIAEPTREQVDEWHGKYVAALQALYDEHRDVYDLKASGLRVVA